jgi:hypothetical protein
MRTLFFIIIFNVLISIPTYAEKALLVDVDLSINEYMTTSQNSAYPIQNMRLLNCDMRSL